MCLRRCPASDSEESESDSKEERFRLCLRRCSAPESDSSDSASPSAAIKSRSSSFSDASFTPHSAAIAARVFMTSLPSTTPTDSTTSRVLFTACRVSVAICSRRLNSALVT